MGIDLIGGYLTEINVTSPTCFQETNRLNGAHLERRVIDFVETQVGALQKSGGDACQRFVLYHFEECPFCATVRDFIEEHKLNIPYRNIRLDPSAREELLRVGGRTQVPCLFIGGKPLYESEDIIRYLDDEIVLKR